MRTDFSGLVKNIYVFLIVVGMPLWFHNGYFDMTDAKGNYFTGISLICIFLFTISFLFFILCGDGKINIKVNIVDFIVVLFLVDIIIGTFMSGDIITILLGENGWGLGTIFVILCILMLFVFSLFKNNTKNIIYLIFFVADVVFILGILNSLGYDPLSFLCKLQTRDIGKYLSTIGNIDWYGEYCCLIVPMTVVYIINYRKQNTIDKEDYIIKILYWITFILGIFSSITSNSDCGLIGMIVSFIYLMWHIIRLKDIYIVRVSSICIIVMAMILGVIKVLDDKKYFLCKLEDLQKIAIHLYVILILIFIAIMGYVSTFIRRKKCYFVFTIIMFFTLSFMLLAEKGIINRLGKYFIFNDSWGTNRGYIWRYAIKIYSGLDLPEKLYGNGLDSFGALAESMYPIELYTRFGKNLINAHNNMLQLLITTGIIGMAAYYTGSIIAIAKGIKCKKIESVAISLSLCTYLLQGLFNNFQPLGVVMSLLLLALLNSTVKQQYE